MTCDKRFQKSSLSAVTTTSQETSAGSLVTFETNRLLTGTSIEHVAGSNTIELVNPGLYLVAFNADYIITATDDVTFSLTNNGIAVPGAEATMNATQGDTANIGFSTIINVLPSCCVINNAAKLQVSVTDLGTITNANITVVKLA